MELKLDIEGLTRLARSFYGIAGVRMGVFHPDGHGLFAYPEAECEFCQRVKRDGRFLARCMRSDREAIGRALKDGLWVYRCHAGLCEAVIPILQSRTPVACLMIGQAAPMGVEAEELAKRLRGHPDLDALLAAFASMPRRSGEELADCAQIMAACAGYIYLNSLVFPQQTTLTARLQDYIRAHYAEPATLSDMAEALGVSVTRLCTQVRAECGSTPHAMLHEHRMERARQLLRETELPVREVANAVGVEDYNYFSRVFRRSSGSAPSAFRRAARAGDQESV